MACFKSWPKIAYMMWDSIDHDRSLTDHSNHLPTLESGGILTAWGFHPDGILHSIWPEILLIVRWLHNINSPCPNPIRVDGIHVCSYWGHAILQCKIVPVHCLRNGALLLAVILLMLRWLLSVIPLPDGTYMSNSPVMQKLPYLLVAEGNVNISQNFLWCASFIKDKQ